MAALSKKRKELRTELSLIEKQIYDLETTYLEETKEFGNIFTGWESYLSSEKVKFRKSILTEDRLFSLSSVTSPASRREELRKKEKSGEGIAKKPKKKKQKGQEAEVGESVVNSNTSSTESSQCVATEDQPDAEENVSMDPPSMEWALELAKAA